VAFDGCGHGLPVALPALRAALDVSEEEGDGAGGEIGHDQTLVDFRAKVSPIVACGACSADQEIVVISEN
jgi:hypothetical protein